MKEKMCYKGVQKSMETDREYFLRVKTSKGIFQLPLTDVEEDNQLIFNWVVWDCNC